MTTWCLALFLGFAPPPPAESPVPADASTPGDSADAPESPGGPGPGAEDPSADSPSAEGPQVPGTDLPAVVADPPEPEPEPEPKPGLEAPSPELELATSPPPTAPPAPAVDPNNPPVLPQNAASRRIHRCLPGVQPCLVTTTRRLLLGTGGLLVAGTATYLIFNVSDRGRIGDPAVSLAAGGLIALGAAAIGGGAALLGGDGPALYDRITTPTMSLNISPGGSGTTDEGAPYSLSGSLAPTWAFPKNLGRLRLVSTVGGDLGSSLDRDPRPQTAISPNGAGNGAGGSFAPALEVQGIDIDLGLDLAVRLPPRRRRGQTRAEARGLRGPSQFRSVELRYKPLFFVQRDRLTLSGEEERINQRVSLTPLNVGARWHVSPRQRFTFYLGPRWDMIGHGEPGAVQSGKPALGPLYSETWFDLDIPLIRAFKGTHEQRKTWAVSQFTAGYVHSRLTGVGYNSGANVGFFGHFVAQYAVRFRPHGSMLAYQIDVGARIGTVLSPYLRLGVVLPDIGAGR